MKTISTAKAPAAIGPYCQGKIVPPMVYLSGQLGIDPQTGELAGSTVEEQAKQSIANIAALLEEAGSDFEHVIKTTCFLADMGDFAAFNKVYADFFVSTPARSCVAVKTLPKNGLVEIEVLALTR